MMDYLFIDHVIVAANLGSTQIKSGISAFELEDHEMVENWIQKVVDAFKNWSQIKIIFKNLTFI